MTFVSAACRAKAVAFEQFPTPVSAHDIMRDGERNKNRAQLIKQMMSDEAFVREALK